MSDFKVTVERIEIEEHPNADALELAVIGGYRSIVRKGMYQSGDLAIYIPEQAIVPDWLIEAMGLVGRLAGKAKNRVKPVKLRGVLSQGLIHKLGGERDTKFPDACTQYVENETTQMGVGLGDDLTDFLGITKYVPKIPTSMSGQVFNAAGFTPNYDVENIKRYPDVLVDGEDVVVTEKLHGTWACFGYHPELDIPIVTSKGLSGKGLAFKWQFPENDRNLYVQGFQLTTYRDVNQDKLFPTILGTTMVDQVHRGLNLSKATPVYVMGEIYGNGVQDLEYDTNPMSYPKFRIFDVYVGAPGSGFYVDADKLIALLSDIGLEQVPVLYTGPWSTDLIDEFTDGDTTLEGNNIREGIVIKPATERRVLDLGRVSLKSVSEAYLLRKGGTEYN